MRSFQNGARYALKNGILLDGTKDMQPQRGMTVYISGKTIVDIRPDTDKLSGFQTIDLCGQYILPGLINMHVHLPATGKPRKKPSDPQKSGEAHHVFRFHAQSGHENV